VHLLRLFLETGESLAEGIERRWVRFARWSFPRMLLTWVRTVRSAMNSRAPISSLDIPAHQPQHVHLALGQRVGGSGRFDG